MNASIRSATPRAALAVAGVLAALALTACGATYQADPRYAAATGAPESGGAKPSPAAATGAPRPLAASSAAPESSGPAASGDAGAAVDPARTPTIIKKVKTKKMGEVVTDQRGWIFYRFDKDTAKPPRSTCDRDCAKVWPPVRPSADQQIIGIEPDLVGTVTRSDGTKQVTLAGWPLYYYIGDRKPGDWTGQNVGKVWFAVAPDGKKNLTCVPTNPPAPPSPWSGDGAGGY